jgi:membrane-associated phospholipid phosphatase
VTTLDNIVNLTLAVVLIFGAYQFYFWCQRQTRSRARTFSFKWDNAIRLRPSWVWIYSGIYYPAIAVVVLSVRDLRHFNYMAFSYLLLLALHILVFLAYPVEVPSNWRRDESTMESPSQRFLAFVQTFDARSNCFPSMHVSVATLTALHTARNLPWNPAVPAVFVLLICASCILTKQHYLIDLPAGLVVGWLAFELFLRLL